MPTLNRYIARKIFSSILVAFVVISGIIMLVDFVETSRDIGGDANVDMLQILYLTALNTPMLIEQTIPFVVLFGVMGALFALNKRSELIVMRASGLSAWNFLQPAALVTALIGVVWVIALNPLAAMTQTKRQAVMESLNGDKAVNIQDKPIWLREGTSDSQIVIHARQVDLEHHRLYDVTFYILDHTPDGRPQLTTRYDAKSARLFKQGFWLLKDVLQNDLGKAPQRFESISRETKLNWQDLRDGTQAAQTPPFWQIRHEIRKAKAAGFDTTSLRVKMHKMMALPITLIAMTIIAAGATLNMRRSGGTLRVLIAGGVLGFGVYFIDHLIEAFGKTGTLPSALAAWSVPLLVLLLGLAFLSWIEDG